MQKLLVRLRGGDDNNKFGPAVIMGSESIMKKKKHGSTPFAVQSKLRFGVDRGKADYICSFNRSDAEKYYYFLETSWLEEVQRGSSKDIITEYYDSVTGKPLFRAPVSRSFEEFVEESKSHGWPSFRDDEVNWENVRILSDGECVSIDGTHLGHNLPDDKGNRYCINLVSIAGYPEQDGFVQGEIYKVYRVLKLKKNPEALFFQSNPRSGSEKAILDPRWPKEGDLIRGKLQDVDGSDWLECKELKQKGNKNWSKVSSGNWISLQSVQYSLEKVTD